MQYIPNSTVQKYCSRSCKDKKAWIRFKESGDVRSRKGGYNRTVYIRLWMEARQSDNTAPCHYCQKRLTPESNFVLDHKVPLSTLSSRKEMMDENNLVVACNDCNVRKGSSSYEEFMETNGSKSK
tara:strand:+ start:2450 stop:2824 length:375 start_codon:yes stop_codon:yes gene_type:complete